MATHTLGNKDIKVLRSLYLLRTPTRNAIAGHIATSSVSITAILNRLVGLGFVERKIENHTKAGRPAAIYQLSPSVGFSIGISVETLSFRITAMDAHHSIICGQEFMLSLSSNPVDHPNEIVNQISFELKRFLSLPELKERRALAIGIALPGMVDTEKGMWLNGLRVSGITHIPMQGLFEGKFKLPVVAEDVARCLAYTEAERRGPGGARDLVYLYLGSGVGSGIIIGDEPYQGSHGLAGEIGHLVVEEEGERCFCGNVGCLETVISRPSILRRFQRRLAEGVISTLQRFHGEGAMPLSIEAIKEAAVSCDRLAQSTLFEIGTFLGDACTKIIKLYNPRTLVIGGPVGSLGEFLREPIWIKIRQKVIPEMLVDFGLEIVASEPQDEALGAALLAERQFWKTAESTGVRFG